MKIQNSLPFIFKIGLILSLIIPLQQTPVQANIVDEYTLIAMPQKRFFPDPAHLSLEDASVLSSDSFKTHRYTEDDIILGLLKQGVYYFNKERYGMATDYFSRTLLLEPNNAIADQYLVKMASFEKLPSDLRIELISYRDLSQFNRALDTDINYIRDKIKIIIDKLARQNFSQDLLATEDKALSRIDKKFLRDSYSEDMTDVPEYEEPIKNLNQLLSHNKDILNDTLNSLKGQYARVRSSEKNTGFGKDQFRISFQKSLTRPDSSVGLESEAEGKLSFPENKEPLEENISNLKNELKSFRQRLVKLENDLAVKDDKLQKISSQFIDSSLKLAEKNMQMKEKDDRIKLIREGYEELNSRLELVQEIIQQKDEEIQQLQQKFQIIQIESEYKSNKLKQELNSKNTQLGELNGMLKIYMDKYHETNETLKNEMAAAQTMEEQLSFAHEQLFAKSKLLDQTNSELINIEKNIVDLDERIRTIDSEPKRTVELSLKMKLEELKKRIQSMKQRLNQQEADIDNINPPLLQ